MVFSKVEMMFLMPARDSSGTLGTPSLVVQNSRTRLHMH
jgi:hypothetical protein